MSTTPKASTPNTEQSKKIAFAAIEPYTASNIVSGEEREERGRAWVSWGDGNRYPQYLDTLYNNSTTLQTIINGTADYVLGNNVQVNSEAWSVKVNSDGETMEDLIAMLAVDYLKYGGFAFSVIRDRIGNVAELSYIDVARLRTDKDREIFYYSEDWKASRVKVLRYPKFGIHDTNPTSIVYFAGNKTRGTYPVAMWNAAVRSAEIEKQITDFHLNNIANGFSGGYALNFNNGVPDDEQKMEIERDVMRKFSGAENAGRIVLSFNADREHALEIVKLDTDDLDKKYDLVRTWCREQIFTAFRAVPCLFGLMTENNGFSREEFLQAFELYNTTVVRPIQRSICRELDKVLGMADSVTIVPFSLDVTDNITE